MLKKIFILIIFLASGCLAFAQGNVRYFNEISGSIGAGSEQGGSVTPYLEGFYTGGLSFGQYFDAGISLGYCHGAAALLTARGNLPFGSNSRTGAYLSAGGGAGFLVEGTVPVVTSSLGIYRSTLKHNRFTIGPFVTRGYCKVDDVTSSLKGWSTHLGIRVGFIF